MNILARRDRAAVETPPPFTPTIVEDVDDDVVHVDETVEQIKDGATVHGPPKSAHRVGEWANGAPKYDYEYPPSPADKPTMTEAEARKFLDEWSPKNIPEANEDGTVTCPVCSRTLRSRGGFSPHHASHRTEAEKILGLPVTPSRAGRLSNKRVEAKMTKKHSKQSSAKVEREPAPDTSEELVTTPLPGEDQPLVSPSEGLAAVLSYSLGRDAMLPVDRVLDVHTWLNSSADFINSLRR